MKQNEEPPNAAAPITPERCEFLLSLTDVEKVRILIGRSVPRAGSVPPLECQFLRAHLTAEENQLLWACM